MSVLTELYDDAKFVLQFRKKAMQSQKMLDAQAPRAGDLAPDFTLSNLSGTASITLADFRGRRPVALIFGSFT